MAINSKIIGHVSQSLQFYKVLIQKFDDSPRFKVFNLLFQEMNAFLERNTHSKTASSVDATFIVDPKGRTASSFI